MRRLSSAVAPKIMKRGPAHLLADRPARPPGYYTNMRVKLDYGRTGVDVELPDDRLLGPLAIRDAAPLANPEQAIAEALAKPTGTRPLAELASGSKSACVVICDITRPVPNRLI